jgi:c-di-GMP-binding flagellar brake protein YcgR
VSSTATISAAPLTLAIGTPVNLQLASDRTGNRLTGRVLGMYEGESIMVHLPATASIPVALKVGDELALRCMEGRTAVAFKAAVLEVCASPYPYFHVTYPATYQREEVRQTERVATAIPTTVTTASGDVVKPEIRDISASGALLVGSAIPGTPGEPLTVSFPLSLGELRRELRLRAVIRNAAPLANSPGSQPRYRCGIQFLDLTESDKLYLLGYVYERLSVSRNAITPYTATVGGEPAN